MKPSRGAFTNPQETKIDYYRAKAAEELSAAAEKKQGLVNKSTRRSNRKRERLVLDENLARGQVLKGELGA